MLPHHQAKLHTDDPVPFEIDENEPLPEGPRLPGAIREDEPGTYAYIWVLRLHLSFAYAELRATKAKLNEVVSAQISDLDPGQ